MNTSKAAFTNQTDNGNIASMQERIMAAFVILKFATKTEIAKILNMPEERIHKRLSELALKGEIYKTPYAKRSESTKELQTIWALPEIEVEFQMKRIA